ncbi:glycosyltransferase family 4 protein [Myxococcus sp. K38C18041901]|uniref:glycosyltransferase family 4 protein n=1 Tax=Myxococcus guangdongensis TaxID=2906760 RepID=UPI0020A7F093|nr:glycosyltransferase family 1 protein [Myxococcus guangdongensis]MCP3057770.1 glycosyltransferase family 4 protein [Myxococcus guangdongensis]
MRRPVSIGSIAFDATLWDEPTTGIGLYTRCLAGALEARGVTLEKLGARDSGDHPRGHGGRTAWTLARLPKLLERSRPALYHALGNFNLPLTRVPGTAYVLTVLDLIPLIMPDTVSAKFRWQFRLWLSRSLLLADQVVCISARTRDDLLERFPEVASRAVVVPIGVDHVNAPVLDATSADYLRSLALPKDYVLYAGSLDVRKNVDLVLDAMERLRAQGRPASLVLAGQSWFGSGRVESRIARLRAEGHDIRPLGYQAEPVFYELMRRAALFVFPSRYEGFGLPPLEAMRLGTPAIVSTAGSLPEVCGDAALAVRPDDAEGLAESIHRLLCSPEERKAFAERGRARAAEFTWKRTADGTLAAYEAALRR